MSTINDETRRRHRRRRLANEELVDPQVAEDIRARETEDAGSPVIADDVIGESEPADQASEIASAISEGAEVATAIDVAESLDDATAALEAILVDRAPTMVELALVQGSLLRAHKRMGTEAPALPAFEAYASGDETSHREQLREHGEALRVALEESSDGVWAKIKATLTKLGQGLANLWKRFVFFCKSAQSQVQQFRRELEASDGTPLSDTIRFTVELGHYTSVGNEGDLVPVIKQLEDANNYIYRDFFHRLAVFAATGEKQPEIDDDKFNGLPGEPRFRINPRGAAFIENPPRCRNREIATPDKATVLRWIDAFLEESMFYIDNYESFKSTAEKIYDAVDTVIGNANNANAADAGRQILFARTHACIDAMESWIQYTVDVMHSSHQLLMGLRKVYIK